MKQVKQLGYLAAVLLSAVWGSAAWAGYVAYAIDKHGNEKPLPENIDSIDAKKLVNIKWGDFHGRKARVAVLEVKNNSGSRTIKISGLGTTIEKFDVDSGKLPVDGIEAILIDALHRSNRFRIVERTVIDQQLEEQDFGASGRVARPSAAKIGKVLGAQYQIQAVVTHYEPDYQGNKVGLGGLLPGKAAALLGGVGIKNRKSMVGMNFRLIDATTSEIIFSKQVESIISEKGLAFGGIGGSGAGILGGFMSSYRKTPIGQAVIAAINKGVFELVKQIGSQPATGSVIKASGNKIYINLGKDAVAKGDQLKLVSIGEELIDPETGLSLGGEEETIGLMVVEVTKDKYAIARPLDFDATQAKKGDKVVATAAVEKLEFAEAWQ